LKKTFTAWFLASLMMPPNQSTTLTHGNVMRELLFSDDKRTETLKNEEIILKFHTPPIWTNSKTFIFQIEGHNPLKM